MASFKSCSAVTQNAGLWEQPFIGWCPGCYGGPRGTKSIAAVALYSARKAFTRSVRSA